MKPNPVIFFFCILTASFPPLSGQTEGTPAIGTDAVVESEGSKTSIRTEALMVSLDNETGKLSAIRDLQTGFNFLGEPLDLFRLKLTKPAQGEELILDASDFKSVKVSTREGIHAVELVSTHEGSVKADLQVKCSFRSQPGDEYIRARIEILNLSEWAIALVEFPLLKLKSIIGEDGSDDILFMPAGPGAIVKDPGNKELDYGARYPGHISFQMMSYFDNNAGLYIALDDSEGNTKFYGVESGEGWLDITTSHANEEIPGGDYLKGYSTVLGINRGSWYDAADQYKTWASDQFWCQTRLADRKDIPVWLKSAPIFMLSYSPTGKYHAPNSGLSPSETLELIVEHKKRAGVEHAIYSPVGWERSGNWVGAYYFPPQPSEEWWIEFNTLAKVENVHSCLMTSGFKWIFHQNNPMEAEPFDYRKDFEQKKHMAVVNPDGTPYVVGNPDITGWWGGSKSFICKGSKEGQEWMKDIFVEIARLGSDASQIDQDFGGQQRIPCYSPDHGHPPGHGSWVWKEYERWLVMKERETKKVNPDFFSFQELANELCIPYQPTAWARDYTLLDWPFRYAWGVPAYNYIYHEYSTAIGAAMFGGQGLDPSGEILAYGIGRCLTFGILQGISMVFLYPMEFYENSPYLDRAREYSQLPTKAYNSFSKPLMDHKDFLILGKMRRPFEMITDSVDMAFKRSAEETFDLRIPAVQQGVFEAPDGRVGVILANPTTEKQKLDLYLPGPSGQVGLYSDGKLKETLEYEMYLSLELEPFEPLFIELK